MTMSWFKHRHWWRTMSRPNLYNPGGTRPIGEGIIQDCRCGAVRTIEFFPGQAPVVRIAAAPPEEK